jgi:hypothetical protein
MFCVLCDYAVAIIDRSVVEDFVPKMREISHEIPEFKAPQLVMLSLVGESQPSPIRLAELGCCSCIGRPPRQAYLRDALSVALSGGAKSIRMKTDFNFDTG